MTTPTPIHHEPAQATETAVWLPLADVHESPDNPRSDYPEASLRELAASLASPVGQLSPIVVRPYPNRPGYEVVFGHRRRRAALLAGLDRIQAVVRPMSNEEADQARLHENMQREDVHFLDEAAAIYRLHTVHGHSARQLAASTGRGATWVYDRIKIHGLDDPVKARCREGVVPAEVAAIIGRLPRALHAPALARCLNTEAMRFGKPPECQSYRYCRQALRDFTRDLDAACWELETNGLGGKPACQGCPNNTSTTPEAWDEMPARTCVHGECFDAKHEAALEDAAEDLRDQGLPVDHSTATRAAMRNGTAWKTYTPVSRLPLPDLGLADTPFARGRQDCEAALQEADIWMDSIWLVAPVNAQGIECWVNADIQKAASAWRLHRQALAHRAAKAAGQAPMPDDEDSDEDTGTRPTVATPRPQPTSGPATVLSPDDARLTPAGLAASDKGWPVLRDALLQAMRDHGNTPHAHPDSPWTGVVIQALSTQAGAQALPLLGVDVEPWEAVEHDFLQAELAAKDGPAVLRMAAMLAVCCLRERLVELAKTRKPTYQAEYLSRAGETLAEVAAWFGVDVQALMASHFGTATPAATHAGNSAAEAQDAADSDGQHTLFNRTHPAS